MAIINLSPESARLFGEWCLQESETESGLVKEMQKLNLPEAVIGHRKMIAVAYKIIGQRLINQEVQKI